MNQDLLNRILRSPRLPSLPTVAMDIIELVQQQNVNFKAIARTISHDPALASKILKTVNSSFYGQPKQIGTISNAVVVLGTNSVKTLALGFSLVGKLRDTVGDGFDHLAFWKHSVYTAVAARSVARRLGLAQQEEAFLGGLLQDVGVLAMVQTVGKPYQELIAQAGGSDAKLAELERQHYEIDHAQIGGMLAEYWNLPPLLAEPIRHHLDPENSPKELLPLIRCGVLGRDASEVFLHAMKEERVAAYCRRAEAWLGLGRDNALLLLKEIYTHTADVARLFDIPTDEVVGSEDILARANEAIQEISLEQAQKATRLEQQNRALVKQIFTDSLTGVANRRRFDQFLNEQFQVASQQGQRLSLLFTDLDQFKELNDTGGHQLGDRALVELVGLISQEVPPSALVARYGGDEFAVVMVGADMIAATRIAENICRAIEATPIKLDDGRSMKRTVSVGVATFAGRDFGSADQLVWAADQAAYAAKISGKNCVRVFTTRSSPAPAAVSNR